MNLDHICPHCEAEFTLDVVHPFSRVGDTFPCPFCGGKFTLEWEEGWDEETGGEWGYSWLDKVKT